MLDLSSTTTPLQFCLPLNSTTPFKLMINSGINNGLGAYPYIGGIDYATSWNENIARKSDGYALLSLMNGGTNFLAA